MTDLHENLARDEDTAGSSNRGFGIVFAVVFLVVALLPLWHGEAPRWWSVGVCAAFALAAWLAPGTLTVPNRLWGRFGLLLHHIVSPLALGLMYYAAVVPTGLLMRLFGKDPLRLKRDTAAASYWIERAPPGPAPDSLKNQF